MQLDHSTTSYSRLIEIGEAVAQPIVLFALLLGAALLGHALA